jgi:hypothetical protein
LEYDRKDDAAIIAVGGRDGRLPVVLRHIVAHPRQIVAEAVPGEAELVVEIVDDEDERTFVTLHPAASHGAGAGGAR